MSLADPLTLLRDFAIANKPITLEGDHVVFGRTRFPRGAPTAYRRSGGDKAYYTIDSVWSLLQNKTAKPAEYVKWCGERGIEQIGFIDRKKLLQYLQGEDSASTQVDYAGVPQVKPVEEASASAEAEAAPGEKPSRKREPTAAEAKAIEEAKAMFGLVLQQPIGCPPGSVPGAPDLEADEGKATAEEAEDATMEDAAEDDKGGAEATDGKDAAKAAKKKEGGKEGGKDGGKDGGASMGGLKEAVALAKPFIRHDRELTSAIVKRERSMRTRSTVLLAPSAKSFPVLTSVLDAFKKRNRAVADLKEKEGRKKRPTAPTAGSAAAAAVPPSAASSAPPPPPSAASSGGGGIPALPPHLATSVPKPTRSGPPSASRAGASAARAPSGTAPSGKVGYIIVPPGITAIVNLYNARALFEKNEYASGADVKTAGGSKETSLKITHTFDDGSVGQFVVLDNPTAKLSAAEWTNVVAVIAQGTAWQFKGWPYQKGETELFSKVVGFYMRFTDEIPNQLTKGWAVQNLVFSREKSRRHEVSSMMMAFWEKIHTFMSRQKPHLLRKGK